MKFPHTILVRLLLSVLLMTAAAGVNAAAAPPSPNLIRVGMFESEGMINGAMEKNVHSGFCYDYLMQVSCYTGWEYEFVYASFSELYDKLRNGEIDLLPYVNKNATREKEVLFSDVIMAEEEYYLVVDQESDRDLKSLNGGTIATIKGYDSNSLLDNLIASNHLRVDILYCANIQETWNALRGGLADAAIWTSNSYSHDDWKCISIFGKKPTYVGIAEGREDILAGFNEATDRINRENPSFFSQLYEKYFSDNPIRGILTKEEDEWLKAHPVLHVGGFANDAPYIFTYDEKTQTATGLTVDLVNGIIDRLNLDGKADFKCYTSIADMEVALASGELDVIIPFYPDYHLAQQHGLIISNTVRVSNMELVFKQGLSYTEALAKVATPSTKLGIYYVRDFFPDSEIVGALNIQDAVDKVLSDEATGAIAQNVALHSIKSNYDNLSSIVLSEGCGTCFATLPENFPLIRILNRGMMYFPDAEISSISAKYRPEESVTTKAFFESHKGAVLTFISVIFLILVSLLIMMTRLKKKADEASRAKTSFLFNMSHDIRTPMNAILGFTDIAIRNREDNEKTSDCLNKIKTSGEHLLSLINDILQMSRIESGTMELSCEQLDLREVITGILQMSQALALQKNIDLEVIKNDIPNPYVMADELHIKEVLINIISNAVKYTAEGGRVSFGFEQKSEASGGKATYRFRISDNGIGMSEDFQKHVFESFAREKTSTISKIEGTGLGLAIVKRIVDLAGGNISVQSKLGSGTTFTVELPLQVLSDMEIMKYKASHNPAAKPDNYIDLSGKRVLVAEDNELNREIIEALLSEVGIIIETAENGQIAVDMVSDHEPGYYDSILMDIQMPVMDGYEATKTIRKLPGGYTLPIIAVSANAFAEDRQMSLAAGMDDHIAKPVSIEQLLAILTRYL